MKPIKVLELSEVDRLKLEKGYHNGPTHSFRIRCKSILLKSEGKSAPQIAEMLEVTVPTVYTWVKRIKPIVEAHSVLKIESDRGKSYSLKIK